MFDTKSKQKLGNDGFVWFYAVVEDIEDPLQLGRMKVRVLGDHSQSKKLIPTEELPWAYMINNNRSSSMQGIGDSPTGLHALGSWVFGFYGDGIDKQQPIIIGSFGGIPESVPWTPKKADVGFQDPNKEFPMGHHIFEQDTNRLARNSPEDHAFEIPEDLVPPQELMIMGGLCPKEGVFAKKYYDKFDEAFVRKFGQGESKKLKCDDTVVGNTQCDDQSTKELKVEDKEDEKCQFFITNNNHPLTIYKFINKERFVPIAKPFSDPMHREVWHEPDNPWATKYPYNKVWEGYHKVGSSSIDNPTNDFVTEAFGYDKTIEGYDGSAKEGIFRKQICGVGSWGLGEEWDSTEGAQRYHRFHPSANYFEIDNDGNEMRKIYGDSFEIDLKDRTILIKGDWNVTVEGNKNELIEGDYNLQVMGGLNTDVRGDIRTHSDGKAEYHHKGNYRTRIDGDERRRVSGNRNTSILVDDYIESQSAERRADEIVRKGGKSLIDEAFVLYELKAHNAEMSICNLDSQIETWNNVNTTKTDDIITLTEKINIHDKDVNVFTEIIATHDKDVNVFTVTMAELTENISVHTETKYVHNEFIDTYNACITDFMIKTDSFMVEYDTALSFEKPEEGYTCGGTAGGGLLGIPEIPEIPTDVDVGTANYPETDGISKCLKRYEECISAAKNACITTLKDPRTLKDYTRFDWEKYHASIESCKQSYEACVAANTGKTCDVCSPTPGDLVWECMSCHDPECPAEDKEWEFYKCNCECHKDKTDELIIDPWLDCTRETP